MHEKKSSFNVPPKKFHPPGLTILHEDEDILVVDKIQGLLTIGTEKDKLNTAHFLLNQYVKRGNERSRNRVFVVHRLDRDTSGILIFAKNERTKFYLQDRWKDFRKKYFTVVYGHLPDKKGEITSYLFESSALKVYSVYDPNKGKYAKTGYTVIEESEKHSLLEIELFTGRKHQIRVHLSDIGHPVVGDKIYGHADKDIKRLALHSSSLTIIHPYTHKELCFETKPPPYFKALVNNKQ
jgi:RluA family pseudouridine synthase